MQKFYREIKGNLTMMRQTELDYPAHLHDNIELVFVEEGSGTAICDGKKAELSPGSFFISFPNQIHSYFNFPKGGTYYVLTVKPAQLNFYETIFTELVPTKPDCHTENKNIENLFKIAFSEYKNGASINTIDQILAALFSLLLNHYELVRSDTSNDKLSEILKYCATHYKEEISIADISKDLYISVSNISHTFNRKLNIHFNEYINSLRITEAVRLLESGKYSITESAFLSGFSTSRTFHRAFKKIYGVTPKEYLKKL